MARRHTRRPNDGTGRRDAATPRRTGRAAAAALEATVRAGAIRYDRMRHLPALIRAMPDELADTSEQGRRRIVRRLLAALATERRRGRARSWTYDMNRHIALRQALAAERAGLATPARTAQSPAPDRSPSSAPIGRV